MAKRRREQPENDCGTKLKVRKLVQSLIQELSRELHDDSETGSLHLRDMIVQVTDEVLLPQLGYFSVLATESIWAILERVPLSSWCAFAGTCRALRAVVHKQAKHYFQKWCGSQTIIGNTSFLPQLIGVCKQLNAVYIQELPKKPHTLIVSLGSYSAQTSSFAFDGTFPNEFEWKRALELGLSDMIIYYLVSRLKGPPDQHQVLAHYCMLFVLGAEGGFEMETHLERVAQATLDALSVGPVPNKSNFSGNYFGYGGIIIAFLSHKRKDIVMRAFRGVLQRFDFSGLLRCVISAKHANLTQDIIVQAITFVFDSFKDAPVRDTTTLDSLVYLRNRKEFCSIVAASPELMSLPYGDPHKTVLDICRLPPSHAHAEQINDPMPLIQSPWFTIPNDAEKGKSMMRVVIGCKNEDTLSHFCSLLPMTTMRQLRLGNLLIDSCSGTEQDMRNVQALTRLLPFKEWADCDFFIRRLFRTKFLNFADSKKFLQTHMDTQHDGLCQVLKAEALAARDTKKQLSKFALNLLKKYNQ